MTSNTNEPLFSAQTWRELRALVEKLDALPEDDRATELARVAETHPDLAEQARTMLEPFAAGDGNGLHDAWESVMPAATIAMPDRVGPFHPLRAIGSGGMGVVYLAQRADTDFTQNVALKLLDGDATRMARLAARERRVLAALTHPNITAFVDAGVEETRAWLAMEYVDGEPLLEYCSQHRLGMRERVELFDQICAAVGYAHVQLVVHRDLKPSNVLVNADGVVKLLDFGIALMLDAPDEQTPATRVFTPEYASPEQLRGERVTTATDVYALGLVLYETVTGTRLPTHQRDDAHKEWTTAELARLATSTNADGTLATSVDPKTIARSLRGDLGRIIAHASHPEPAQRYASVLQMREDLRRWLGFLPIGIARPGWRYVSTRFMRRNRLAVAITAIAALALIATAAIALRQAHQATLMATRAERTKNFLSDLFSDADPFNSKKGDKSNVNLLTDAAKRIDKEFPDAPEQQVQLREIIASALTRLGEPKLANKMQRHSVEQIRQLYGEHSPQLGGALAGLAQTSEDIGEIDTARTLFAQAYALLRNSGDTYRVQRMTALTGLAKMANRRSDYADAQRWYVEVLHERQSWEGPESQDIAMDLFNLASCALYQEHYAQAETLAMRAHTMLEHVLGVGHPRFMYVDLALGLAQVKGGHAEAGVATLKNAVALGRANLQPGAEMMGTLLSSLALAHFYAGDDEAAIKVASESRHILASANGAGLGLTELMLGRAQLRRHRNEALASLRDSRIHLDAAAARIAGAPKYADLAAAALGAAEAHNGDAAQGVRDARAARTKLLAGKYASSETLAWIDLYLADALDLQAQPEQARAMRREALTVDRRVFGADNSITLALAAKLGG